MKRRWLVLVFLVAWLPFFIAAWDNTLPADSSQWNNAAGFIRANNNALEVVLGIDLSMEGSAYPWYQATAPTTKADGSTALDATDNGFLWVDSDTRILYTYIHGTGFRGIDAVPAVVTFTAADATPTVVLSSLFTTDSAGLTITDFDDGTDGKTIVVLSKGAVVYDTTTGQDGDHNLDGSSANITTASGDITVWRNEGGSTWHLVRWNDASIDNSDQITGAGVTSAISAAGLQASGATVFNTTLGASATFQDLDLSAIVGANIAIVWLEIKLPVTGTRGWMAKTKGFGDADTTQHYNAGLFAPGPSVVSQRDGGIYYTYMQFVTDSAGVIQHAVTNNSITIQIKLIAYLAG